MIIKYFTLGEDSVVKCFTSDILTVPEAAALTRENLETNNGYRLFNIDGVENGSTGQGIR